MRMKRTLNLTACTLALAMLMGAWGTTANAVEIWWQATADAPWSQRDNHGAVDFEGKMWVLGGRDANGDLLNDVWSSTDGVVWTQEVAAADWAPRDRFGLAVYEGRMWVIGGREDWPSSLFNDVWSSSNGVSWTLENTEAPWSERHGQRCEAYDGKLWMMGGRDSAGYHNDVYSSTNGIDWDLVTSSAAWPASASHGSAVHDGKLWVMGGWIGGYSDSVYYTSNGTAWTLSSGDPGWVARAHPMPVSHDDQLWIMGGNNDNKVPWLFNDVWKSADGFAWSEADVSPAAWSPRSNHATLAYDKKIWVLGGATDGFANSVPLNDVWAFGSATCTTTEAFKVANPVPEVNARFGGAVAMYGDIAVVGAAGARNTGGSNDGAGAVYVFKFVNGAWVEVAELISSDLAQDDEFGGSVAVWGSTIVVGAGQAGSGVAYVYHEPPGGWGTVPSPIFESQKLAVPGLSDVAVHGDTIVVGAMTTDNDTGKASVFCFDGISWVGCATLEASDGVPGDRFGRSVSICENTIVAGADHVGHGGPGSVYLFERPSGGWAFVPSPITESAKLTASDGVSGDRLGISVACAPGIVVAGAIEDDDNGNASGSAYVFELHAGAWGSMTESAKLTAEDGKADDNFGISVDVDESGQQILIGAYAQRFDSDDPGLAYVFCSYANEWGQCAKLLASDRQEDDQFGGSVALSEGIAIVGANHDDDGADNSGAAYVFDVIADCNEDGVLDACGIQLGLDMDCNSNGVIDGCEADCNENGIADDCEVAAGSSADCNTNSIPDECDPNFDGDGLIDDCDSDIDDDGVPNESDVCDYTPLGAIIEPDGSVLGDLDGDCDVDLVDYAIMQQRFTGPN